MNENDSQFWAMLVALVVCGVFLFVAGAFRQHQQLGPHSPGRRVLLSKALKRLVTRDSNSDSDSDSGGDHTAEGETCTTVSCTREHDWILEDGNVYRRVHLAPGAQPLKPLAAWIRDQLLDEVRSTDIVRGARGAGFRASQATIWREMRKARRTIKEEG